MKTDIRAVELVRRIRDAQAKELAGKTSAEIIEFFQMAGTSALEEVRSKEPTVSQNKVG